MILDAGWAPTPLPIFATAGRDKQIKLWTKDQDSTGFIHKITISEENPVTAMDFLDSSIGDLVYLAIGTETGQLKIYSLAIKQEFVATEVSLTYAM